MCSKLLTLVLCSNLLALPSARAVLLAYEGYDYVSGTSLVGLNGGTGWNGGWVNVSGGGLVYTGNLMAGGHAPGGYDFRSTGNLAFVNNGNRSGRFLDCSLNGGFGAHGYVDVNGHIGADGKTLYISFLQQPSDTVKFYEFEFHRGDLGDPGRIAGLGNDFNSTSVNLRAPNATQTPLGQGSTDVNFYVVRIDFKSGNDDVCVYRNPVGNTEADNEPVLTMVGAADMSFDGIALAAFNNGVTVKHDEIRMGETWGEAMGDPPAFVVQPTNQNLYIGQSATFTSSAQSLQTISYQWYHGSNVLPGQTNSSLLLSNLQLSDADIYQVIASNALGAVTSSLAALTVQGLGISIPDQVLTVGKGSNLVIIATVGGAHPVSMQWFKDGLILKDETNSTISRSNGDIFDCGQYFLVAHNAYGAVTSAVLTVNSNFGAILAYEGFNYAPGADITGQSGGLGWSGAWENINGASSSVLSANLSSGTNEPAGYDAHSAGGALFQPNSCRKGRFLDCSASGGFL